MVCGVLAACTQALPVRGQQWRHRSKHAHLVLQGHDLGVGDRRQDILHCRDHGHEEPAGNGKMLLVHVLQTITSYSSREHVTD